MRPLTGKPDAGKLPVRFGGRGKVNPLFLPLSNFHPLLKLGLQFAEAGERRWTSVYQVRDFELWP